jgi:hypothetical protein
MLTALDSFCEAIYFSKTARCAQTLPAFGFFSKKNRGKPKWLAPTSF